MASFHPRAKRIHAVAERHAVSFGLTHRIANNVTDFSWRHGHATHHHGKHWPKDQFQPERIGDGKDPPQAQLRVRAAKRIEQVERRQVIRGGRRPDRQIDVHDLGN